MSVHWHTHIKSVNEQDSDKLYVTSCLNFALLYYQTPAIQAISLIILAARHDDDMVLK